jgi:hypothetical protein
MKGKEIFTKKKTFDLEKAVALSEFEGTFVLKDFEVYFSKKYSSEFTVIETEEGTLIYSWSKVIAEKFKKLADLPEADWKGLELQVEEKTSEAGRNYFDLVTV